MRGPRRPCRAAAAEAHRPRCSLRTGLGRHRAAHPRGARTPTVVLKSPVKRALACVRRSGGCAVRLLHRGVHWRQLAPFVAAHRRACASRLMCKQSDHEIYVAHNESGPHVCVMDIMQSMHAGQTQPPWHPGCSAPRNPSASALPCSQARPTAASGSGTRATWRSRCTRSPCTSSPPCAWSGLRRTRVRALARRRPPLFGASPSNPLEGRA
jgi:hypothetical protein